MDFHLERVTSRTLMDGQPTLIQRVFAKARQTAGCAPASVIRKFEAEGADLMHAHFRHDGILALPYARNLKVPLVVTLHGHDVNIRPECYRSGEFGFWHKSYPDSLPPWCGITHGAARPAYVREHFDIMRCTKKIEDLYDDILPTSTRTARKRQLA